ncbi:MAG: hypothetical protein RIS47_453 [Bacteroidota bacterium]
MISKQVFPAQRSFFAKQSPKQAQNTLRLPVFLALSLFLNLHSALFSQAVLTDTVVGTQIRTVLLHPLESPRATPAILLNSANTLLLSFDDLAGQSPNYNYRVIHCNKNWQPSKLVSSEYLDGYDNAPLRESSESANTIVSYTHYQLEIPNNDFHFTKSGNYIVEVFTHSGKEKLVLRNRFFVYEQLVNLQTRIQRPIDSRYRDTGQDIEVELNYSDYPIDDPAAELTLEVQQNGPIVGATHILTPLFVRTGAVEYRNKPENSFLAGNEYRWFNTQNIRYKTTTTERIAYQNGIMNFWLSPSRPRYGEKYSYDDDLNGQFMISLESSDASATRADYVGVYFNLYAPQPYTDGQVFVVGALSNWQLDPNFRMTYNFETQTYQLNVQLKQGYYNYQYLLAQPDKATTDPARIDGTYFETENDYNIYLYHNSWRDGYDRLIAFKQVNSLNKVKF